jgi:predicted nuclease of restriction endonuclease-like (RecB) superfamily
MIFIGFHPAFSRVINWLTAPNAVPKFMRYNRTEVALELRRPVGGEPGGNNSATSEGKGGGSMSKRKVPPPPKSTSVALLGDIRALIDTARQRAALAVNSELSMLYWRIGLRIHTQLLSGRRAGYGEEIVAMLAQQLVRDYGGSFAEKNLRRMVQFASTFPDEQIVVSLIRQLSWTHFIALIPLKDPLQREYYAQMCSLERWSVRTLRERIDSLLYERTVLSKKPEALIAQELATLRNAQRVSPALLMRDPYILDFLGLRDTWQEGDLEAAISREMESFLLELGVGFTFVARQKRIQIDDEDFHLDLLLYNRKLRRLVAVELKVGEFKAAYKGQMELYLRWLDRHEREPNEASPLGIILCTGKKSEQIELLELDKSGIHVAEYLTTLPPRAVLVERLQQAAQRAQVQLASRDREGGVS